MNCKTVEMFLYNYLDNELSEQEYLEVEEHLKSCSSCRNLYNYESEFHKFLKSEIKKTMVDAPAGLKEKILNNKKQFSINYNIFTTRGMASIAALFISIIFISKFSMGYSTLPEDYNLDLEKDIKVASNNECKLSKWIKLHNYKNFKLLKFSKNQMKITPLGLAFNKNKPVIYYHYKGHKLLYKNINKLDSLNRFTKFKIKNKTYFLQNKSGISIAVWKNKNGTASFLGSKIPESELKTILYSIK